MLHAPLPVTPKEVKPQTVFDPVRLSHQIAPQLHPLLRVHNTLEYRFLHTLPMVPANLRHAAQPAPASPTFRRDIVRNQDHHVILSPDPPISRSRRRSRPDPRAASAPAAAPARAETTRARSFLPGTDAAPLPSSAFA